MYDAVEEVWRQESSHILSALQRYCADAGRCEDAAQEALEAALSQWPSAGMPQSPRGWLIRVASRRIVDSFRRDEARRMREQLTTRQDRTDTDISWDGPVEMEETLEMLLLCCHPDLSAETRVILSLNTIAALPANQIADLLYLGEATTSQRISRAKATIRKSGGFPEPAHARERLHSVLQTLYLMFAQGHTVSRGEDLTDCGLSKEALRLTRALRASMPTDPEVAGLLALMLLTEARRPARTDSAGELVTLRDQDRELWDREAIREGVGLIEWALARGPVGPYQVQAAIAAVHDEALTWETTDWPQIRVLYLILAGIAPSPTVQLNLAAAEAMTLGPQVALDRLAALSEAEQSCLGHRFYAARGHLFDLAGRHADAIDDFRRAAQLCLSLPERAYLERQGARLARASEPGC